MKKKIVYATMLMSTIALLSTGFAAWIISMPGSAEKNGTIYVDTVSTIAHLIKEFKWTSEAEDTDPEVVYSIPKDTSGISILNSHISNDNTGKENGKFEHLTITGEFYVTNVGELSYDDLFEPISFNVYSKDDSNNPFNAESDAIKNGYITGIPEQKKNDSGSILWEDFISAGIENNSTEYGIKLEKGETTTEDKIMNEGDSNTSVTKYTITIKFGWGFKFNYKNPYYYYNNDVSDEDWRKDNYKLALEANENLDAMNKLLDSSSFKLSIKTKA